MCSRKVFPQPKHAISMAEALFMQVPVSCF